jgi:hypothetical protein
MVITSEFDEKKVQVNTTLFKERCVVKDKAEYDLVYNQREYRDFLGEKKPIQMHIHISTICTMVVDDLFIWKVVVLCAIPITSSFE